MANIFFDDKKKYIISTSVNNFKVLLKRNVAVTLKNEIEMVIELGEILLKSPLGIDEDDFKDFTGLFNATQKLNTGYSLAKDNDEVAKKGLDIKAQEINESLKEELTHIKRKHGLIAKNDEQNVDKKQDVLDQKVLSARLNSLSESIYFFGIELIFKTKDNVSASFKKYGKDISRLYGETSEIFDNSYQIIESFISKKMNEDELEKVMNFFKEINQAILCAYHALDSKNKNLDDVLKEWQTHNIEAKEHLVDYILADTKHI